MMTIVYCMSVCVVDYRLIMPMSVHRLPETPSSSLNSWLHSHYTVSSNTVHYFTGMVVCLFYEAASTLHRTWLRAHGGVDARTAWRVSCGALGVAVAVAAWLAFSIVLSSTFIIHALLHYLAIITALIGLGLGAAGAFYFGDDVMKSTTTAGKTAGSDVSGTSAEQRQYRAPAYDYTRPHDD